MRNKPKLYLILLVGLVFLLASSVIGCSQSETQTETWTTYHSPTYGYTIDYPQNWDLDTSEAPNRVFIDSPLWCTDCPICSISILARESSLSIDEWKNVVLLTYSSSFPDFEVISSHSLDGKYEWVIEFTFTLADTEGIGKSYIGETSHYQFVVRFIADAGDYSKCEEIAETFIP